MAGIKPTTSQSQADSPHRRVLVWPNNLPQMLRAKFSTKSSVRDEIVSQNTRSIIEKLAMLMQQY